MNPLPNQIPDPVEDQSATVVSARPPWRPTALGREILIVLGVKAVVLFVIWWAWFSAPQAPHMKMPQERVQQRVIEIPAVHTHSVSQPLPAGYDNHAAH
jgi:hypothetical protein